MLRRLWLVLAVLLFLNLLWLSAFRRVPTETPWLEPSLCSVGDAEYNRFVSFIPPSQNGADGRRLLGPQMQPAPGYGCPADIVRSTPQDFVIPLGVGWPAVGANVSLVIYRGDLDSVHAGFSLRDARGTLLLQDAVSVGPSATPREQWEDPSSEDAAPSAYAWQPASRQLLFASSDDRQRPGARRLLKGGLSNMAHVQGVGGAPLLSTSAARPWGGAAVRPTAYGMTARHVVMAGAVVVIMHHHHGYGRYYEDEEGCYAATGCPVRVAEPLSRDVLHSHFTMSPHMAFPLTLTLSSCNVSRAANGYPSLFFAFFSEGVEPSPPLLLRVMPIVLGAAGLIALAALYGTCGAGPRSGRAYVQPVGRQAKQVCELR
ncbi:hypothetical protein AB1Y20_001495 [Prymnesium parvum]|uniref:DOMON domain-containing protein n=1 Tax=Prymnesium parvum TaxID=97485 RepID=A0AB34K8D0_PRYPA